MTFTTSVAAGAAQELADLFLERRRRALRALYDEAHKHPPVENYLADKMLAVRVAHTDLQILREIDREESERWDKEATMALNSTD